jgi:hypothetical protein
MFRRRSRLVPRGGLAVAAAGWLAVVCPDAAAQVVNNTRSLDFGRFVAASGGAVTVAPSGQRSGTGGVVLLSSPAAGAANFLVTTSDRQASSQAVVISLPADGSIRLSNGNSSMPVNAFVASPSMLLTLPAGGQVLAVGATMTVAPNQPSGNYSGSFPLIVNFQ